MSRSSKAVSAISVLQLIFVISYSQGYRQGQKGYRYRTKRHCHQRLVPQQSRHQSHENRGKEQERSLRQNPNVERCLQTGLYRHHLQILDQQHDDRCYRGKFPSLNLEEFTHITLGVLF